MKSVKITGDAGESVIMVGECLENLKAHLPVATPIIITDHRVRECWGAYFPPSPVITIGTGEKIKNLQTVGTIYERLIALEADRATFIVGIGGGIVCDIAGFAASTYLRGVGYGFVPTTLLSQVDASVGGKNGVNFSGYKNIVGLFNQPQFVICDLNVLSTLPPEERACGFAEIIKHAAIADPRLFDYLESHCGPALALDSTVVEKLVYDSVIIKSSIVNRDAREKGSRRLLNFGHTFGHAIEKTLGVRHGEAVGAGMVLAAELSVKRGVLEPADASRITRLIDAYGLPVRLPYDRKQVLDAIRMDKKREGQSVKFVLLNGIGRAFIDDISLAELDAFTENG